MVEPVSITVGVVTAVVGGAIGLANRAADINERKSQFTQETVRNLSEKGYNAVVVSPGWKAYGYDVKNVRHYEGVEFTIFAATRNKTMIVENYGDGGYVNWALRGTNWVRWGPIVKFHPHWNQATMGKPYEVRAKSDFPGWPN